MPLVNLPSCKLNGSIIFENVLMRILRILVLTYHVNTPQTGCHQFDPSMN